MTIEERLAALEKQVQRLSDIEEIKCLKGKYFRCLDTKDWAGLEETFSPNVSTSYSNGKLVFHGPKEVTAYFAKVMPETDITLHQGHTPEIWFESDTVAYGHWYLQDNLVWVEPNPYAGQQCQGSAIYTDKYEKVDGKWLIVETGYIRVYEEFFKRDDSHKITKNMHMPVVKKKPAAKK
jgi:bile-acid 7alpha-dehydratase